MFHVMLSWEELCVEVICRGPWASVIHKKNLGTVATAEKQKPGRQIHERWMGVGRGP